LTAQRRVKYPGAVPVFRREIGLTVNFIPASGIRATAALVPIFAPF